jgi:soluble lytic murein transglycosylase-like protein
MQLMPETARRYGASDRFDPQQNIHAGARYLKALIRRYDNDIQLALAAYNAGEDAVDRCGRCIPPYRETQAYVPKVWRVYQTLLGQAAAT